MTGTNCFPRRISLFFALVAVLLALALCLLRLGIGVDLTMIWKVLVLAIVALNGSHLLERLRPFRDDRLSGMRIILALAIGLGIIQLGMAGLIILTLLGMLALAFNVAAIGRPGGGLRPAALAALALLTTLAVGFDFASTKYASAYSDVLVLYGRADGDVLIHSALISSLHYFLIPSAGIDGIAPAKYHYGMHAIIALLTENSAMSAVFTFLVFKLIVIYALTFAAALNCASTLRSVAGRPPSLAPYLLALTVVALIPPFDMGYLTSANSETAMFSGLLIFALLPMFHSTLTDPAAGRAAQVWALLIGASLVLPLSLFKLSAGYSWATAIFIWSLIAFGARDRMTWCAWGLTSVGGLLSVHLFTLTGQAKLVGTPYFVEYGFAKGDYLLPITLNIGSLLFIALTAVRWWREPPPKRARLWADPDLLFVLVTLVLANLPGLLLDIESGNAGHFIVQQNLLALPFLVTSLVALGQDVRSARRVGNTLRAAGAAIATLIVLFGIYSTGKKWVADARAVIAQRALINTGDGTYYQSTRRRDLKADASRYLHEEGLGSVLAPVTVTSPGAGLASALMTARSDYGNALAAYATPDAASFWDLTYDCDGKSLFSMAIGGIPMVNGFPPCPPKFVYNGYPPPPEIVALDSAAICGRARALGFSHVLVIRELESRGKDEILDCTH